MGPMLDMLKIDLGIKSTTAYDDRLIRYLNYSHQEVQSKGVILDVEDGRDQELIVMYAAWLWRRRNTGEGMPRMLRYALNNRLIGHVGTGGMGDGWCN